MRGVVGGNHVDAAVSDPLEHGVAIRVFAEGRVHLEVRVVLRRALERRIGQREMVRRDLAGHVDAAFLADRTARSDCRVLMCAMCTWPPVSSASDTSRSTISYSATPGMPRSPSAEAW